MVESALKSANKVSVGCSRATALTPHPDVTELPDAKTVALSWRNENKDDVIRLAGELIRMATSKEFADNPKAQINLTGYRFTGRSRDKGFKVTATINDRQ